MHKAIEIQEKQRVDDDRLPQARRRHGRLGGRANGQQRAAERAVRRRDRRSRGRGLSRANKNRGSGSGDGRPYKESNTHASKQQSATQIRSAFYRSPRAPAVPPAVPFRSNQQR